MLDLSTAPFLSPGTTTPRSFGERAGEIKNVKDYGAKGDGVTDDTAAIQRAVDWTSGKDRGVIFFPPGISKITAPITFNHNNELSIIFRGVGRLSNLVGNFAGYILDRSNGNPTSGTRIIECLGISNSHAAGGGIRFHGCVGGIVRDCQIGAFKGFTAEGGGPNTVDNVVFQGGGAAGSIGALVNGVVGFRGCDFTGLGEGIRHWSMGLSVLGCRFEVNKVGVMLGRDANNGVFQSSAFFIAASSMEANGTAIHAAAAVGGQITGISQGISEGATQPCGLLLSGCYSTLISGVNMGGPYSVAAIDARGCGGVTFIGCTANNTLPGGAQWLLPDNAAAITRIHC